VKAIPILDPSLAVFSRDLCFRSELKVATDAPSKGSTSGGKTLLCTELSPFSPFFFFLKIFRHSLMRRSRIGLLFAGTLGFPPPLVVDIYRQPSDVT